MQNVLSSYNRKAQIQTQNNQLAVLTKFIFYKCPRPYEKYVL